MAKAKVAKKDVAEVKAALDTVSKLDVGSVVSQIGSLQVDVQNTLANLSATITGKLGEVDNINKAIEAKKANLQELYEIDAEAVRLEEIKSQREAEDAQWNLDLARRDDEQRELAQDRNKAWKREEEEHNYAVKIRNQRVEEEYQATVAKNQRDEAIRQQTLDRGWADRENTLKAQEQEVVKLKDTVAGIDARIKQEVGAAEAIVGNRLKKQYEQDLALLKKDMDTATLLHKGQVASLEQTIANLSDQLDGLRIQLEKARQDAKDVTTQALQSASDKVASVAVQRMAETQNQSGGKK